MSKIDHSLFSANKHALEKEYEHCPQCGSELVMRNSKSGAFLGCASYPHCDYIRPLSNHDSEQLKVLDDSPCPECQSPLAVKNGRYGMFIGCTNYPQCHYIADLHNESNSEEDTLPNCPKCQKHPLMARTNKYGKTFYSCKGYPDCKYSVNSKPVAAKCEQCGWEIMLHKQLSKGTVLQCPQKSCAHQQTL